MTAGIKNLAVPPLRFPPQIGIYAYPTPFKFGWRFLQGARRTHHLPLVVQSLVVP